MRRELADFLDYCLLERRLAPLTCSAYARDVGACLEFLEGESMASLADVRPADLRRFLAAEATHRPAPSSQARTIAALKAGLEKRVTAHTLRHTAATWLREATGDARLVARYLGHADLSTVSRYAHVADDDLHVAATAIADRLPLEGGFARVQRPD